MSAGTIRALIVDDEPLAREGVRLHLASATDVEVVGECADGDEAVRSIRALEPDLVFLDVQMPGLDGFGVLEALGPGRMPTVVFVTAYDQFALRAFDAHALDYLLKPFDADRFRKTLDRARDHIARHRSRTVDDRLVRLLEDLHGRPAYVERLAVKAGGRIVFLRADEIDWVRAEGNYVRLHAGGKGWLLRETMAGLEAKLDPARFLRIHRSILVRIEAIKELEPLFQGEYLVRLRDGTELTSSRGARDRLQGLVEGG